LDITNLSKEKILDRLPTMYEQFKNLAGIDISQEKMEVGPTVHYSMGGVVVNTIAVQNCRRICSW
jgi:succinate dehydrogenase / fumarate reductase, flavoprotein subunit